jgi:UDP-glucose 4-epimerase
MDESPPREPRPQPPPVDPLKILVVGVAGGQGRLVARRLSRDHHVVGVDRVPWRRRPPETPFFQVDVRTRGFEDVVRSQRPEAVVHLGFERHFRGTPAERYDLNVRGTKKLIDVSVSYGVSRLVVLSTSYVYGALPENPSFMDEEHPLSASRNYPEIRDLVELDTLAAAFMWKHPELRTSILRPVPTLGYFVDNSMANYLRQRRSFVITGFDPMVQFMHEDDLAETGGKPLPLPEPIARPLLGRMFRLGIWGLPSGAIDYIKYPCTISGERFTRESGFRPLFSLKESFRSLRI